MKCVFFFLFFCPLFYIQCTVDRACSFFFFVSTKADVEDGGLSGPGRQRTAEIWNTPEYNVLTSSAFPRAFRALDPEQAGRDVRSVVTFVLEQILLLADNPWSSTLVTHQNPSPTMHLLHFRTSNRICRILDDLYSPDGRAELFGKVFRVMNGLV